MHSCSVISCLLTLTSPWISCPLHRDSPDIESNSCHIYFPLVFFSPMRISKLCFLNFVGIDGPLILFEEKFSQLNKYPGLEHNGFVQQDGFTSEISASMIRTFYYTSPHYTVNFTHTKQFYTVCASIKSGNDSTQEIKAMSQEVIPKLAHGTLELLCPFPRLFSGKPWNEYRFYISLSGFTFSLVWELWSQAMLHSGESQSAALLSISFLYSWNSNKWHGQAYIIPLPLACFTFTYWVALIPTVYSILHPPEWFLKDHQACLSLCCSHNRQMPQPLVALSYINNNSETCSALMHMKEGSWRIRKPILGDNVPLSRRSTWAWLGHCCEKLTFLCKVGLLSFGRFEGSAEVEGGQRREEEGLQPSENTFSSIWKWETAFFPGPQKSYHQSLPQACLQNRFCPMLGAPPVLSP